MTRKPEAVKAFLRRASFDIRASWLWKALLSYSTMILAFDHAISGSSRSIPAILRALGLSVILRLSRAPEREYPPRCWGKVNKRMAAVSMGERERSWAYFVALAAFATPVSPFARWQKAAIFAALVSGARLTRGFSSDSLMVKSPQNSQIRKILNRRNRTAALDTRRVAPRVRLSACALWR